MQRGIIEDCPEAFQWAWRAEWRGPSSKRVGQALQSIPKPPRTRALDG
jgi:hypothetical protein